ncbi:MAG: DUF1932 domain-containing protein [Chloroflexi bacterium]|nr:DUF1932 domain-containing protein [Chloroflexota bacterium]
MPLHTIAIVSPGEMGSSVGRTLRERGYRVITCLEGRSERTRNLAGNAGFEVCSTLDDMVVQADLIMSILVPAEAAGMAARVAKAIRATKADVYFADCNAIAPQTVKNIERNIVSAGGKFIDGSIIGLPPDREVTRFYTSGEHAHLMDELDGKGIAIRRISDEVGKASAIKMCYAGFTKATSALSIAALAAAEAQGLSDELAAEFEFSQAPAYAKMQKQIPSLPSKAYRWAGEMDEIAASFESVGITPNFHKAAGDVYRRLSRTPFADESPEETDASRDLRQTIAGFVAARSNS